MPTLSFHGAVGTVTGSCYTLKNQDQRIFIDCGYFQGTEDITALNHQPLGFDPSTLRAGILTHAHLDHCGRLPLLSKGGFHGHIYMTAPTRAILEIVLNDTLKIMSQEPETALYDQSDIEHILNASKIVEYHEPFMIADMKARLYDAGHILGSSFIEFTRSSNGYPQTITFSGDLGNSPQDLIRPTEVIHQSNIVIMESTYGDREHQTEPDTNKLIADEVNAIEKSGGTLLIPCFSIQRTQEVLHRLNHLAGDKLIDPNIPVFLDSPMAIRVTKLYEHFHQFFNQELTSHYHREDPFSLTNLTLTPRSRDSKRIEKTNGPKIIIAGSGMMTGGRIVKHASQYLPDPASRLLFVGYQGVETLGRNILESTDSWIVIEDNPVKLKANINQLHGLSSHAGQTQLHHWLSEMSGVKQVFLTHGEDTSRTGLKNKILENNPELTVELPKLHSQYELNSHP